MKLNERNWTAKCNLPVTSCTWSYNGNKPGFKGTCIVSGVSHLWEMQNGQVKPQTTEGGENIQTQFSENPEIDADIRNWIAWYMNTRSSASMP